MAFLRNPDLGWSLSQACHYAVLKGKNRRVRRELHSIQRCQEEPAVPAPSPSETARQKEKGPRKIFLGKRYGAAQGAGDKHCPLLRKQLQGSQPCGGLCCPKVRIWGTAGALSLRFLITRSWRAKDHQELPRRLTEQPEALSTVCKLQRLILTSGQGCD